MNQAVKIGLHPLDTARNDLVLDLPTYSPVTHGMLQINAVLEGEKIVSAEPILGSMHRGVEKLFESRDYRQILMLANRHEWLSPITGEVGLAELLESALGIEVPQQAIQLRKALIAYSRITSHLAFLAGFPFSNEELTDALRNTRESLIVHQQEFIGNRMHPMITRIGGFTHGPSAEWLDTALVAVSGVREIAVSTQSFLETQSQFAALGILSNEDVVQFGISGPAAHPGGVQTRLQILVNEILAAINEFTNLVPELIARIDQPINVLLPKVPRIPEGEYVHSITTPLGKAMWFMVSRGDKMPYRLKLRSASLHTVLALGRVMEGASISDAKYIVSSMPFITGDAER